MKINRLRKTKVLIIGAGPAGTSCAMALTQHGIDTVVVDKFDFPRDKICGDALIPDSLNALSDLGLREQVLNAAHQITHARIYAPNGEYVGIRGDFATLSRYQFDQLLLESTIKAGALFLSQRVVENPIEQDGQIRGAVLRNTRDNSLERIEADLTVLATGASIAPLRAFGVAERSSPSAIALRSYYEIPETVAKDIDFLCISYDARICPGYGWIFPGPNNVYNLGVGFFYDSKRLPVTTNLRELWRIFLDGFPLARLIAKEGTMLGTVKGAPLRCNMSGARFHRPGLVVIGEAVGLTYSFSGEGIGKAMDSGIIAADTIASLATNNPSWQADVGPAYEQEFREKHAKRYAGYRIAQSWLAWPSVCNYIARRGVRSAFVQGQLAGMITESVDAQDLFSVKGMVRALIS